ncbi:flavin reductase (NADPH)-like [Haliotis asinina]|uniref:flavin reductase (NADPH)-like n=1 Tax=Haliotis asinina TaxID=109174 RepID=UPI003531FB29
MPSRLVMRHGHTLKQCCSLTKPLVRESSSCVSNNGGRLSILGASGPSGLELVREALLQGYEVQALVRSPDKITLTDHKLTVERVNIFKTADLANRLRGSTAVLSCLGARASLLSHQPCTLYSQSMKTIAAAMTAAGVHRFVCVDSWSTKYTPGSPKVIEWFSRPLFLGSVLSDMAAMEDYARHHCSNINYTFVRAPGLSSGPSTGKRIKVTEGQYVKGVSLSMPRRDVVKFMLSAINTQEWDRKCVAIGI